MEHAIDGTILRVEPVQSLGQRLGEAIGTQWQAFDTLVRHMRTKVKADGVHDLRVALRRLLALTDLVRETVPVPSAMELRRPLNKCLKSMGTLRDAQVQLDIMGGLPGTGLDPFHDKLRGRVRRLRRDTRRRLAQVHLRRLSAQRDRMLSEVEPHWTAVLSDRHRSQTLEAVDRAFSEVIEARSRLDMTNLETVHQMRVPFRRFRYMVEAVQPFLVGVGSAQFKSMQAFQSMMGDIHDLDLLSRKLARFRRRGRHSSRLAPVQDELAHRLLLATDSFMAASDEIYSFWDHAWFPDRKKS